MNKYASFFAMALTTSGFAAVWLFADSPNDGVDLQTMMANDQIVAERVISYRCFKATLESTLVALRKGEVTLREAHTTIRDSASRFNPKFLERLSMAETGKTIAARLAQNIVGHVRSIESARPSVPSPLPRLEIELRAMLAEMDK